MAPYYENLSQRRIKERLFQPYNRWGTCARDSCQSWGCVALLAERNSGRGKSGGGRPGWLQRTPGAAREGDSGGASSRRAEPKSKGKESESAGVAEGLTSSRDSVSHTPGARRLQWQRQAQPGTLLPARGADWRGVAAFAWSSQEGRKAAAEARLLVQGAFAEGRRRKGKRLALLTLGAEVGREAACTRTPLSRGARKEAAAEKKTRPAALRGPTPAQSRLGRRSQPLELSQARTGARDVLPGFARLLPLGLRQLGWAQRRRFPASVPGLLQLR
uniref:Uncharacterized protein n=1 Tax=Sphaerodactylus townsendi TaxID=933632 RepID=A0ACB8G3Y5_9SAUR